MGEERKRQKRLLDVEDETLRQDLMTKQRAAAETETMLLRLEAELDVLGDLLAQMQPQLEEMDQDHASQQNRIKVLSDELAAELARAQSAKRPRREPNEHAAAQVQSFETFLHMLAPLREPSGHTVPLGDFSI